MIRRVPIVVAASVLVLAVALPVGAAPAEATLRYALAGEARAMELGIGTQGLSLGVAFSKADSTPSAIGVAAGQCSLLGNDPDPNDLPCNESTTASSSYPGDAGSAEEQCAGPAIPAPLDSVLDVDLACGTSQSGAKKGVPFTTNFGKVGEVALEFDLAGLVPQIEEAKEQVIDELQEIINQAPEPIKNALNQLLDSVDAGQAGRILIGPARSDVVASGGTLAVSSSAAGVQIGLIGIPDLDKDGVPILGTSDAIEDGLIVIEVGAATASATLDLGKATAAGDADPALVRVKVRDITQSEPTYITEEVAPGQSQTILAGTPLESTITAAVATTDIKRNSAASVADAVRLHLLKGVQGGIILGLGRTTAAASIDKVLPTAPIEKAPEGPKGLPATGVRDGTPMALGLLLAAALLLLARRRAL